MQLEVEKHMLFEQFFRSLFNLYFLLPFFMYSIPIRGGIYMSKLFIQTKKQMYKLLAFILFGLGVFSINSSCDLIFYQQEEPTSLKRFSKR